MFKVSIQFGPTSSTSYDLLLTTLPCWWWSGEKSGRDATRLTMTRLDAVTRLVSDHHHVDLCTSCCAINSSLQRSMRKKNMQSAICISHAQKPDSATDAGKDQ